MNKIDNEVLEIQLNGLLELLKKQGSQLDEGKTKQIIEAETIRIIKKSFKESNFKGDDYTGGWNETETIATIKKVFDPKNFAGENGNTKYKVGEEQVVELIYKVIKQVFKPENFQDNDYTGG